MRVHVRDYVMTRNKLYFRTGDTVTLTLDVKGSSSPVLCDTTHLRGEDRGSMVSDWFGKGELKWVGVVI